MICPLCSNNNCELFEQEKKRRYFQCKGCSLVFVPRDQLISLDEEKERYDAHENDPEDTRYHDYLSKIVDSIVPYLDLNDVGLDFGSGKSHLLENIFKEKGFQILSYDIYFWPDQAPLSRTYDFIVMSEVIEHLRDLTDELGKIQKMLKKDGKLVIKTKLLPPTKEEFKNWFYKRDKTHIQFFNDNSFRKLGYGKPEQIGEDLFLFRNNA